LSLQIIEFRGRIGLTDARVGRLQSSRISERKNHDDSGRLSCETELREAGWVSIADG
jgi:hypothetical protein